MDTVHRIALALQLACQLVYERLRIAENQRTLRLVHVDKAGQRFELVAVRNIKIFLGNSRRHKIARFDFHHFRTFLIILRDAEDRAGHRRREQDNLQLVVDGFENPFDVFTEAHVEHFVRFVQNDHLQVLKTEHLSADHIHDASRRSDDDLCALFKRADLLIHRRAAEYRYDTDIRFVTQDLLEFLCDLERELACRKQYENLRRMDFRIDLFRRRYRKREGLAGPGLGFPDQIASFQ